MGASGSLTSQRWMLAVCFLLASVLGTGESISTTETQKYTCRTFGSGVVQPFNGSRFYVRSNCPFTLTRFTHNRVECDITIRRGASGLLLQVEIIINKIRTVVQNGSIQVETRSVSLPYDHTYQHIFHYGIYTKLRSSLLPLSVTWHSVPGGIGTLWVRDTNAAYLLLFATDIYAGGHEYRHTIAYKPDICILLRIFTACIVLWSSTLTSPTEASLMTWCLGGPGAGAEH
uniref:VWFD domain-containing protein n=1 Tax=Lates calcarifer TaxID=8187 RepID=A0A4W6DZ81_LATCA